MLLCRFGPEGFYAAGESMAELRVLFSEPLAVPASQWTFGRPVRFDEGVAGSGGEALRAPIEPGKIVCVGRNYRDHAAELGNPVPAEPLLFLKSPSSLVGPRAPIVLPPESSRVDFEGEIAIVLGGRLRRATADEARRAILGVTAACDVTARDLQKRDGSHTAAKSFDSFCPLGPVVRILGAGEDEWFDGLEIATRVSGVERQRARASEMIFPIAEALAHASRRMTLEPGDLFLTGTPAGVGPLADGDVVEVEIPGVGILVNPVEAWLG
jgi:2-keto-4-pentenoate hydratase/2-oxohepta-3-ene-1,7-dioic acid hydratase in catechol pathway